MKQIVGSFWSFMKSYNRELFKVYLCFPILHLLRIHDKLFIDAVETIIFERRIKPNNRQNSNNEYSEISIYLVF